MKNKNKTITEKQLQHLNSISQSKSFKPYLKKLNTDFTNFNVFIDFFENYISNHITISDINKNSFDDIVFESIISRLEYLHKYKKICIRIYLESHKNNAYFLILTKHIYKYFSKYSSDLIKTNFLLGLYFLVFQIWIEDNENLDQSMSFLGKSLDFTNKFTFLKFK